jgi:hypothetical protein
MPCRTLSVLNTTLLGLLTASWPLMVRVPKLTISHVRQLHPWTWGSNTITATLLSSDDLSAHSIVNVMGMTGISQVLIVSSQPPSCASRLSKYDTNLNNELSRAEFDAYVLAYGASTTLSDVDLSQDGVISSQEWSTYCASSDNSSRELPARMIGNSTVQFHVTHLLPANVDIMLVITVRNGGEAQSSPPAITVSIDIECGKHDARVFAAAPPLVNTPLYSIPRAAAALVLVSPRITQASLRQRTPIAAAANTLTLTVTFGTDVPPQSTLNISGLRALAVQYAVSTSRLMLTIPARGGFGSMCVNACVFERERDRESIECVSVYLVDASLELLLLLKSNSAQGQGLLFLGWLLLLERDDE